MYITSISIKQYTRLYFATPTPYPAILDRPKQPAIS